MQWSDQVESSPGERGILLVSTLQKNRFYAKLIRDFREGVASAAIAVSSAEQLPLFRSRLVDGESAEPFQYNDTIARRAQAPVPWLGSSQEQDRFVAVAT